MTAKLMLFGLLLLAGCKKDAAPQVLWPESWNKNDPAIMIEEMDFDARLCTVSQTARIIAVECRRTTKQTGNATAVGNGNTVVTGDGNNVKGDDLP